jgi:hypothetical protein
LSNNCEINDAWQWSFGWPGASCSRVGRRISQMTLSQELLCFQVHLQNEQLELPSSNSDNFALFLASRVQLCPSLKNLRTCTSFEPGTKIPHCLVGK